MLKMQIVLTSIARRWYNVMKRRCVNVKIRRPSDVKKVTLKRRCKNVENAHRSDVDCKTLLQRHETTSCQRQNTTSIWRQKIYVETTLWKCWKCKSIWRRLQDVVTTSLNDVDFMSILDVNLTSIILRQNNFWKMMKRQIELTSIPGHSYNVHSVIESRAVTRTLIGRGCIFIYSCSARQISFQIDQFEFDWKKYRRAEHEYMNIHPPPTNVLVTALVERGQIVNRQRKITLNRWVERICFQHENGFIQNEA